MESLSKKHVLITGAGSGIGRALALAFAERGNHLILNDLSLSELQETEKACLSLNSDTSVSLYEFSVTDMNAWQSLVSEIDTKHGHLDIVINNAGIAHQATTVQFLPDQVLRNVMEVNFFGMVNGTQACLPLLRKSSEACLANVSSLFGLTGIALQGAYCASKFAIRGYTETLRMEAQHYFPHVNILSIHPGGVSTQIAESAIDTGYRNAKDSATDVKNFNKALVMPPQKAAEIILGAIKANKTRILVGKDALAFDFIARMFPQGYTKVGLREAKRRLILPIESPQY
jgi:NAD(P)-dependent dehydrogenase (short-subunit alcohol dehydrogenase family)